MSSENFNQRHPESRLAGTKDLAVCQSRSCTLLPFGDALAQAMTAPNAGMFRP